MAKIIIQGPKEEQVFDVTSEIVNTRTDEELDKALWCCFIKERNCASCSCVKEENCREKMQIKLAQWLQHIEVAQWLQRIDRARQDKERREKEGANDN